MKNGMAVQNAGLGIYCIEFSQSTNIDIRSRTSLYYNSEGAEQLLIQHFSLLDLAYQYPSKRR